MPVIPADSCSSKIINTKNSPKIEKAEIKAFDYNFERMKRIIKHSGLKVKLEITYPEVRPGHLSHLFNDNHSEIAKYTIKSDGSKEQNATLGFFREFLPLLDDK